MKFDFVLALALLIIGVNADAWAQFCNDDHCSQGCGRWVAVGNPGCLAQNGRRSIKMKGSSLYHYALIYSPLGNSRCGCQSDCENNAFKNQNPHDVTCLKIRPASSFRFIGNSGNCPRNNC
ncbi:hypothetical protein BC941DRAFT_359255 [Chlamydoabsidia padenii]|nr:hypothetical protein BC941DRAFT_359255 [Chlamydoabsidia padenii]